MNLTYYIAPTGDAYENLARDEYFLTHLPSDTILLYFYVNDNAVIIGRNQNAFAECDRAAMSADSVQLVRRITGGGAVYHDGGNLNFSFLAPSDLYDTDAQDEILLSALQSLGIKAERNGRNDLVADGRKFSGNAFGERAKKRLRHGTLLINSDLTRLQRYLTVSAKKLRAKGVASVRSRVCNLAEFRADLTSERMMEALIRSFEAYYGSTVTEFPLGDAEKAEIRHLRAIRASDDWVLGEAPSFDYTVEERFSFGMAELCVSVADGRVDKIRLFTDALDTTLAERVQAVLAGIYFSPEAIAHALQAADSPELREIGAYIEANP